MWVVSDEREVITGNVTAIWYSHEFQLCAISSKRLSFFAGLGNIIPQNSKTDTSVLLLKLSTSRRNSSYENENSESNATIVDPG
jgi:hypothetical protein